MRLGPPVKGFLAIHRRNALVRKLDRYLVGLHEAIENRNYDARQNGEWRVLEVLGEKRRVRTLLDVGANVGDWTLHAAACFPDARVFSLEILESTYLDLVANCVGRGNVSAHHLGLSDERAEIEVFSHDGNTQLATAVEGAIESFHGLSAHAVKCSVTTGDEFCADQQITHVDFLKIDVEGMEDRVLKGFTRMLQEQRISVVQFEYGFVNVMTNFLLRDFYEVLTGYGMSIGKIYPTYVDFRNYRLTHEDFLGPNYLAVHASWSDIVEALRD